MSNSSYFHKNIDKKFEINKHFDIYGQIASRTNKDKLKISLSNPHNITVCSLPELKVNISDISYNLDEKDLVYEKVNNNESISNNSAVISTDDDDNDSYHQISIIEDSESDSDNSEISVSSGDDDDDEDKLSNNTKESSVSLSSYETIDSSYEDEEQAGLYI